MEVATKETAAPTFPETPPTLGADEYVVYHGDDAIAIYSAQDGGVQLNNRLNFTENTLMVYAETVYLDSKIIKLPGKELGIFCNRLVLSLEEACIDVSGEKGDNSTSAATKATDGGRGGSVWLYVEEPTPELTTKLSLMAFGGDGGRGTSGKDGGGAGGDGGTCGTLKCYMGSTALRYAQGVRRLTASRKWAAWILEASESISDDVIAGLISSGVDEAISKSWKTVVANAASLVGPVMKLQDALGRLVSEDPDRATPTQATVDKTHKLLDALNKLMASDEGPGYALESDLDMLRSLAADCDAFFGGAQKEQKLRMAVEATTLTVTRLTVAAPATSELVVQLEALQHELRLATDREPTTWTDKVCHLAGGKGGAGGSGTTPDVPSGKRGVDRPDSSAQACLVSLVGNKADCSKIDQAIASPEQCQMLLEKADGFYFTGDLDKYPLAMRLYNKLIRRLGFLEVLIKDEAARKGPLALAFHRLDSEYGLTTEALPQLSRIYQTATRRLNGIVLRQDIWGHSDLWVPRLSLAYYGDRVKGMIDDFKDLEATFRTYAKMVQKQKMTETQLGQAQLANGALAQAARDQMDSLSKHGGELEIAADKIALCRPVLAAAREKLSAELEKLRDNIQHRFAISADTFMDALSTLSMAPEGFTAIVQAADVVRKSWTKLEDAQGSMVKKEYVVRQVETCQATMASLVTAFQNIDAGDLTADDPGYAKIFSTASDIEKILDDFSEQVPTAEVRASLTAFLAAVTKRNTSVLSYNALVQTFLRLRSVLQGCEDESRRLGERALSLNPRLPAIYFWLKRLKSQAHLAILQQLNNQARALSFWGPMPVDSITFDPPGPLDGALQLHQHQERLVGLFEKSYEGFQSGGWNSWPADRDFRGEGIRIPLGEDVIASLKKDLPVRVALLTVSPTSHTDFRDMANVRVTQVRVWLLGATVGPVAAPPPPLLSLRDQHQPGEATKDRNNGHDNNGKDPDPKKPRERRALRIEIAHLGDERIWAADGTPCSFRHAAVTMQFSYETSVFNASGGQCSGSRDLVYGRQDIEHDYAGGPNRPGAGDKPPIGPFGDWKVQVRQDVNPGLDLGGVTEGWIEFCGRNQAATEPLKGLDVRSFGAV